MDRPSACMISYSNYAVDARVKKYVGALLRQGYQVDVFMLGRHPEPPRPGLRVFRVMEKHWGSRGLPYAVAQLSFLWLAMLLVTWHFLGRRYRLVHVHNIPDFMVFAATFAKLGGARVILDVHDPMPEAFATKFGLPLDHPLVGLLRWEERLSARFAHQVITTNELQREVLCSHGIPPEKIEIVINVANDEIFRPAADRPGGRPDGLLLAYHGTIAERLGIDLILDALRRASRECPGVRLLLIGAGDDLPRITGLIRDWGLADRVRLMGLIPVEEVPAHLAPVDLGIIGTRAYTEAKHDYMLPVKMLEYAAMEIPTIAPRLETITRYFDESSAFFYTPDDPEDMARRIVEIYRDPARIDRVRPHLRDFNRRYSWPTMERKYLAIVDRCLGRGACSPVGR